MPIKLKSLSQPTELSDGLGIVITRRLPPKYPKYDGNFIMELSPSKELLDDYK
jgi:hypothetical protein